MASNREQKVFNEVLAMHGAPAYIRRAQNVEAAWSALVDKCSRKRDKWLAMSRIRLAVLRGLAGEWTALAPLVAEQAALDVLVALERDLRPSLRQPIQPTASQRRLRGALGELIDALEYFNQRWGPYVAGVDLTEVNRLREDYNRYYLLEKECAVRSALIARQGFQRLSPATVADLTGLLPLLPIPR
jgi:hypothetical protein